MRTNVDRLGRVVRGTVGIWLLFVALSAARNGQRTTAAAAGLAGVGLLQNALVGFCGLNRLFGIDSTDAVSPGA